MVKGTPHPWIYRLSFYDLGRAIYHIQCGDFIFSRDADEDYIRFAAFAGNDADFLGGYAIQWRAGRLAGMSGPLPEEHGNEH